MRKAGFVLWYDSSGDDGILCDFEGNQYYFNSWSFKETFYKVTGKCKKTGRKKTILTRYFPGFFLGYKHIKDWICETLVGNEPFYFSQADGIVSPWAVKMKYAPELAVKVLDYRIEKFTRSLKSEKDKGWIRYYKRCLKRLKVEREKV